MGFPVAKDPTTVDRSRRYRERKRARALAGRTLPFGSLFPDGRPKVARKRNVDRRPYAVRFRQWAASRLVVPTGLLRGKPFTVEDWQAEFIAGAMAPGIREAGLSIARKNGKSALIAAMLLYELCELQQPEWRCVIASETGELAKELRRQIEMMRDAAGLTGIRVVRSPQPGRVESAHGGEVTFLAADRATGHAVGADLAIVDEAGLLGESKRDLWDALRSCLSGKDGRFLAISVRSVGPMFSELADRRDDPAVYWQEYAPAPDAPIDSPDTWRAGNPALGRFKSLEYMRDRARMALTSPADGANFRALDLNMRVSPGKASIVPVEDWTACCVSEDELPAPAGPCYLGVDLGGAQSLSAVVAYWPDAGGRLDVWTAIAAVPDPIERGKMDGVGMLYRRAVDDGFLMLTPGRTTDVAALLTEALDSLSGHLPNGMFRALGADRFRQAELGQSLDAAGFGRNRFQHVAFRGTGAGRYSHGSADVRAFQRAVLERRIKTRDNPLAMLAISESEIRTDAAGNPALDKAKARSRIDIVQAAVIAVGLPAEDPARRQQRPAWRIAP